MNSLQNKIQLILAAIARTETKLRNLRVATEGAQNVHQNQMAIRNVFTRKQVCQGKLLQNAESTEILEAEKKQN